jgi:hypothetical protein
MFKITIKDEKDNILFEGRTEKHQPFERYRKVVLGGKKYIITESLFTITKPYEISVVLSDDVDNPDLTKWSRGSELVIDHD